MSYVTQLIDIATQPKKYFSGLSRKKLDYLSPYFLFLVVMGIGLFIDFLFEILGFHYSDLGFERWSITVLVLYYFFMFILLFITPFLNSVFVHLGLMVVAKKNDYKKTFNAVVYTDSIGALYLVLMGFFNTLVIVFLGSTDSATALTLLIIFLLGMIAMIHLIALETIAVKTLYSISTMKAFLSVILIPLLLSIFIIVVVLMLLVTLGIVAAL